MIKRLTIGLLSFAIALGCTGAIAQIAQHFGLNAQELSQRLARVVPQAVDHLTPGGNIDNDSKRR